MQRMQNPFNRTMLPQGGSPPIMPQKPQGYAPQAPQRAPQGQGGIGWQHALGFGLMSLGEGMGGPRSLAPLIIQSMLQRQAQERELQAEQGRANTEQKAEIGERQRETAEAAQQRADRNAAIIALGGTPEQANALSVSDAAMATFANRQAGEEPWVIGPNGDVFRRQDLRNYATNGGPPAAAANPFTDLVPGEGGSASAPSGFPGWFGR